MKKPAFTDTMQIGIVVRDLDATIRRSEEDYGIGPWVVHQFKPGEVKPVKTWPPPDNSTH